MPIQCRTMRFSSRRAAALHARPGAARRKAEALQKQRIRAGRAGRVLDEFAQFYYWHARDSYV